MLEASGLAVGDEQDLAPASRNVGRVSRQRRWWQCFPHLLGCEAAVGPGQWCVHFGKCRGSPSGMAVAAPLRGVSDSIKIS